MITISTAFGAEAVLVLRDLVGDAKRSNALTPVTVIVRDNIAAITTRRALARGIGERPGVAAVTVLTLDRLAEQLLASAGLTRPPVTSALLTELWRRELATDAGVFAPVVDRPATIRALVRAHSELRTVDATALAVVEQASDLGRDLVRLHRAITATLLTTRRDAVAVLDDAASLVRRAPERLAPWGRVIVHLPDELDGARRSFLAALDDALPTSRSSSVARTSRRSTTPSTPASASASASPAPRRRPPRPPPPSPPRSSTPPTATTRSARSSARSASAWPTVSPPTASRCSTPAPCPTRGCSTTTSPPRASAPTAPASDRCATAPSPTGPSPSSSSTPTT